MIRPVQDFMRTEAAAGLLLLVMVPIALLWANGPFSDTYDSLWSQEFGLRISSHEFSMDLRHWVNDGLMALFFFVVGLEIKRELTHGDLRDRRKALTPVLAALGGMAAPALIYVVVNAGGNGIDGWAIPMATDIAIVLGFLAVVGDRVPASLKTFLLTLAIADDVGAIIVIALFFSPHALDVIALVAAAGLVAAVHVLGRRGFRQPVLFVVLAVATWAATYAAGIHATLAGVALALVTPSGPVRDTDYVDVEQLGDLSTVEAATETATIARESVSSVEWLQHLFHPWSSYLVLPIFALANAGIPIGADSLSDAASSPIAWGIVAGLLLGKPIGICLLTFVAVRVFGGNLPTGVSFRTILAGSLLCGIGFTVSLFITDLAFMDEHLVAEAKAGVLAASVLASALGVAALRIALPRRP
jgi:NhaA family Na+:H+ antiporter